MGSTRQQHDRLRRCLVVTALALGLAGCGAHKPPPYRSGVPGGAGRGLRLAETPFDRTRVLTAGAVSVRVSGAGRSDPASVVVRPPGGGPALAGPTRVPSSGGGLVKVPLTDAGRQALAGCAPGRPTVELQAASGDRLASAQVDPSDSGPPCGRFFGPEAPWNQELPAAAPLDPRSAALVQVLRGDIAHEVAAHFGPDINAAAYSTRVYTVPADQPHVAVAFPPDKAAVVGPLRSVPLPADAQPATGTDHHLVLWQPATDTMWEFFGLERQADGWHAEWGGRITGVSRSDGVFRPAAGGVMYGATATGLSLAGGLITPGDLRRGRIDHALAFAIPDARAGAFALPAQRTDGVNRAANAIPEGARFRLDPKLNVASLDLPPLGRMIAQALQRYGMILRDQSAVVTFYAQIPTASSYPDMGRAKAGEFSGQILAALPWDHLQLMRMDLRGG